MQGSPRAQRQKELEGAGDTVQVAQRLEILGGEGEGQRWSVPCGASRPRPLLSPMASRVVPTICPSPNPWDLCV